MIVMKFGGSSVANRQQIEKVLGIVRGRLPRQPVVVSSAHKGMTDLLIHAARKAAHGEYDPSKLVEKQSSVAEACGCPKDMLEPFYAEIRDLLRGLSLVKELSPRSLDYIASFGERMAVRVIADFFSREGLVARPYDVWDLGFITDSHFGNARPLEGYGEKMRAAFAALPKDVVPIVTGFVGKNEAGEITTVGRNGSDLTATLVAAALRADEAEIWSDTDGVMTADPNVVSGARNIPTMRFDEAAELAYFGSRVLHPSTLLPAMEQNVPVRVLNTNRPDHPGTVIAGRVEPNPSSVTSIAYKENQVVATITTTRMFGQAGFLSKVFEALGRHHVVVDMISTSEISVSFTTGGKDELEHALAELGPLGSCEVKTGKTILVVVGQHLPERRGIGADVLGALARAGVNIEMLSYGMGSINLAMLIDDRDIGKAVPALHRTLFETN